MIRVPPALLALLLVSCAREVYVCGPCGGSRYTAHGLPDLHAPTVVQECFTSGCSTRRLPATRHDDPGDDRCGCDALAADVTFTRRR